MKPFNLHIKKEIGVQSKMVMLPHIVSQLIFLFFLNHHKLPQRIDVSGIRNELFQLVQIGQPTASNALADKGSKFRVAQPQAAALGLFRWFYY